MVGVVKSFDPIFGNREISFKFVLDSFYMSCQVFSFGNDLRREGGRGEMRMGAIKGKERGETGGGVDRVVERKLGERKK